MKKTRGHVGRRVGSEWSRQRDIECVCANSPYPAAISFLTFWQARVCWLVIIWERSCLLDLAVPEVLTIRQVLR